MTKTQIMKAFNVTIMRSRSNIITFNNDRGVFILSRVFSLALLILLWWTTPGISLSIGFSRFQKAWWLALLNGTFLFKLFLLLHDHMHHLLQLHIMMQPHNMSYIMIKAIHESSITTFLSFSLTLAWIIESSISLKYSSTLFVPCSNFITFDTILYNSG